MGRQNSRNVNQTILLEEVICSNLRRGSRIRAEAVAQIRDAAAACLTPYDNFDRIVVAPYMLSGLPR
jgi:hypothetical protein